MGRVSGCGAQAGVREDRVARWVGFRVVRREDRAGRTAGWGANDGLLGDEFAEDVLKDRRMDHQHGAVAQHEQQKQALRHVEPTSGEQRNVHRVNRN